MIRVLRVVRAEVVVGGPMAAITSVLVMSMETVGVSVGLGWHWHHRGDRLLCHGRLVVPWGHQVLWLLLGSDGNHEETQEEANPEMSGPGGMVARQHGGWWVTDYEDAMEWRPIIS